jgi:hypothetical protein
MPHPVPTQIVEHYCIVYLVFVGKLKKNFTHQTWWVLVRVHSPKYFGECLKKMVSHTVYAMLGYWWQCFLRCLSPYFSDSTVTEKRLMQHIQCGKPFFSNTRQNNLASGLELVLTMFGEWNFFLTYEILFHYR